jgi:hypothetical protein
VARITAFAAGLLIGAAPAKADVRVTRDQALAEAFPGATIERRAFVLTDPEARDVETLARVRLPSRLVTAYRAWRGDTLVGTAFFDSRTVRTMPAVFLIVVAPDTSVARIDVLAFHEPPDYRPPTGWLGLFGHRKLDDRLWPGRDLRGLTGATLTTRAVTESVRLSLAIYRRIVSPRARG